MDGKAIFLVGLLFVLVVKCGAKFILSVKTLVMQQYKVLNLGCTLCEEYLEGIIQCIKLQVAGIPSKQSQNKKVQKYSEETRQ